MLNSQQHQNKNINKPQYKHKWCQLSLQPEFSLTINSYKYLYFNKNNNDFLLIKHYYIYKLITTKLNQLNNKSSQGADQVTEKKTQGYTTPNDMTLKFVPENFLTNKIGEYKEILKTNPTLVNEILDLNEVQSVFIAQRFISITVQKSASWHDLYYDIVTMIDKYKDEIVITEQELRDSLIIDKPRTGIEKKISEILNERVRPSVQQDGGDVDFISYDEKSKIVYVSLQGACTTCPHSKMTLNNGILKTLKYFLPNDVNNVIQI